MADVPGESSQPEGNNFDNGFEKLEHVAPYSGMSEAQESFDPFSPESTAAAPTDCMGLGDDLVSSTSPLVPGDMPEEDLYTNNPDPEPCEAEPEMERCFIGLPPNRDDQAPAECYGYEPGHEPQDFDPDFSSHPTDTVSSSVEADIPAPSPPKIDPNIQCSDRDLGLPLLDLPVLPAPCCTAGGWIQKVDPRVLDLVYWRDVKKTGVVAGSLFVVLLSLALFSVLSVMAYLSLAALTVTISFRVYKNVLGAVQKTGEGHPFKQYLEVEICLPEDKVHHLAEMTMTHISCTTNELRRLFLVEDIVDSIKFGLFLWVLTYIGSWFNGMTLIILCFCTVFTLPKVYETYKVQIDQNVDLVRTQVRNVIKQVQEKIPLPGKKKSE